MTFETWIAFAALETMLCLVPGPAVLFVLGQGLVQGPRSAVAASVGILSANAGYFAISATSRMFGIAINPSITRMTMPSSQRM